ncbi:unnamed protein product [Linum tenue]|uniref:CRM domain-containing protein n=1 Tax=Linum tenue TaxID=586396 RepID=A0AAV0S860_9ROSI|nr:unnamed protein product [Linum tenue]
MGSASLATAMALKLLQIPFPISAPPASNPSLNPNPASSTPHHRPSTELRFSRWNNANAREFEERRRSVKEIEDDIRRARRFNSADNIVDTYDPTAAARAGPNAGSNFRSTGTPSSPSRSSIPGRRSKYSKPEDPKTAQHPAFRRVAKVSKRPQPVDRKADVKLSEDGLSYVIDGAPFEFKYSYTEAPKTKPLKLREPPFSPFGPVTMPRPWTGRAPLPPSKKKLKEFDSFQPPPPGKKGIKSVQAPGPFQPGTGPRYVNTRDEILGEPLTKEEIKALVEGCIKAKRQLNMGRDGLTHNMLDNIHAHWKRRRVCKVKCKGVCTVDLDNVCEELEERTGGKIIYKKGGVLYLFRGRNYNYRTRPHFPLMLWKPHAPVYPRLIQQTPDGLTLDEASEMRKKGRNLVPICKLGKNGVYAKLADNVREAFEECELVRINCQGMNGSDFRKIGAKLRDIVPCVLISFESEHILMWRGRDWKSSLSKPTRTIDQIEGSSSVMPELEDSEVLEMNSTSRLESTESPNLSLIASEEQAEITSCAETFVPSIAGSSVAKESEATTIHTNSHETSSGIKISADVQVYESETTSLDPKSDTDNEEKTMIAQHTIEAALTDDTIHGNEVPNQESLEQGISEETIHHHPSEPTSLSLPSLQGVVRLLNQAVENGAATLLNRDELDADNVYKRTVAFSRSAPLGPVFQYRRRRRKEEVEPTEDNAENEERSDDSEAVEFAPPAVFVKRGGIERKSSGLGRRRKGMDEQFELVGGAVQGSLGVDELARLLA